MVTPADAALMARALFLAERGRGRTSPNPIVGAVVATPDGIVVGQGAHLGAGGPHAEVVALDAAGGRARGATLYCTLEPCCHTGRTGPCVERIAAAGIARVVVATEDRNPQVHGRGIAWLRSRGLEVAEGVRQAEARRQLAPFFCWISHRRPFVTLKVAVSRDGFVGRIGQRVRLTSPAADRYFHRERAATDAIAVGSGTVLADDPQLTARLVYRGRPLTSVLFDWSLRVTPSARVFSTAEAGPIIMVVSARAHEARPDAVARLTDTGAAIEPADTRDLGPILAKLAAREILSLLVEGGPRLHAAFLAAGLVDRIQRVVTSHVLGDGVPSAAGTDADPDAGGTRRVRLGADEMRERDVHGTD